MQVEEEESLWTQVIDKYGKLDAEWVSDIVSRAWGNRGNSRSRQVSAFLLYNAPKFMTVGFRFLCTVVGGF